MKRIARSTTALRSRSAALLAGFAILAAAVQGCGHSGEWQYGYDHREFALQLMGQGFSAESACRSVAAIGFGRENGKIVSQDAYDGCMASLSD